ALRKHGCAIRFHVRILSARQGPDTTGAPTSYRSATARPAFGPAQRTSNRHLFCRREPKLVNWIVPCVAPAGRRGSSGRSAGKCFGARHKRLLLIIIPFFKRESRGAL